MIVLSCRSLSLFWIGLSICGFQLLCKGQLLIPSKELPLSLSSGKYTHLPPGVKKGVATNPMLFSSTTFIDIIVQV